MTDKIKGFLICENAYTSKPVIIGDSTNGPTTVEAILQDADVPNRNKRLYSLPVLTQAVNAPYIQERIATKTLYGEAGHPLKPDMERQLYIDQTRISHIIPKLWFENNILKAVVESAQTQCGRDFQGLIRQGSAVAFSMRGIGPVTEKKKDYVEIKGPLSIFTWDWVIHPSHSIAYMQKVLSESTFSQMVNENNMLSESVFESVSGMSQVREYLKSSSKNIQTISEQFQIDPTNAIITLNEDRKTVDVVQGSETLRIFLEDYIVRELDDYFLKL